MRKRRLLQRCRAQSAPAMLYQPILAAGIRSKAGSLLAVTCAALRRAKSFVMHVMLRWELVEQLNRPLKSHKPCVCRLATTASVKYPTCLQTLGRPLGTMALKACWR